MEHCGGRLFSPYKALGLICGRVPVCLRRHPKRRSTSALCAIGNVVHQYNLQNLRLLTVSDSLPLEISCLALDSLYVYVGYGNRIAALQLSRKVEHVYDKNGHDKPVKLLLPFGDHLISIDEESRLLIWDIQTEEIYAETKFDPDSFEVTAVCHPATYLNKVLLGSEQGALSLWNVKTLRLIYQLPGWGSGVRCMEQSPAIHVLGVGLADGTIKLHNVKFDETLFTFRQDWGPVLRLAFRTDGPPILISSGDGGQLAFWDLEKRRLIGQLDDCHKDAITGLVAVHGEPLIVTSSPDNALKQWVFDRPDGLARQLVCRDGHSKPPKVIRFHGSTGEMVISAGGDRTVREFSTWKNTKQQNLGTAGLMRMAKAKKARKNLEDVVLPPASFIATDTAREAVWDNVICGHEKSPLVTSWTSRRFRLGSHRFLHERFERQAEFRDSVALCGDISTCGNFTILGYSSGHLDCWNIQSGLFRESWVDLTEFNSPELAKDRAHSAPIKGVAMDDQNQLVLSGCAKGRLKFWRFASKSLLGTLVLNQPISLMRLNRDNNLLAVALANSSLVLVDIQCRSEVRRFKSAHQQSILDMAFSANGHWLISTGSDGFLKVWDLPTAALVEVLKFKSPCVSLSASPTGEYIATCHRDHKGIYLWVNRLIYQPEILLKPLPLDYCPEEVWHLPHSLPKGELLEIEETITDEHLTEKNTDGAYSDPEQIETGLVTLSGQPTPRWAQLLQLDIIRQRNKPKEPPKKPQSAPFFLPTVSNLRDFSFEPSSEEMLGKNESESKVLQAKLFELNPRSEFGKLLQQATCTEDFSQAFNKLKLHGPAMIETELRNLSPFNGGSFELLAQFLRMILLVLESNLDFELAQSYLGLFLKVHRDELWFGEKSECSSETKDRIRNLLQKLSDAEESSWSRIDTCMNECLCQLQWLQSALL